MNPFNNISGVSKKDFYFDQLALLKTGAENAAIIKVKHGDTVSSARMYVNKFFAIESCNYKTKLVDGDLWVVNLGGKTKRITI